MSLCCSKCFGDSHGSLDKSRSPDFGLSGLPAAAPSAPSPTMPPGSWGTSHSGCASFPGTCQALSCLTLFKLLLPGTFFSLTVTWLRPTPHSGLSLKGTSSGKSSQILLFVYLFIWLSHAACGILVPRLRIEPVPPAVEAWSPNHWTAREFSQILQLKLDPFPLPLPL